MGDAPFIHRIHLRPADGDLSLEEDVNGDGGRRISKSTSATPIPGDSCFTQPPAAAQRNTTAYVGGDSCDCCPYGYHIDVDFVQYAAEEAKSGVQNQQNDSLKLFKGRKSKTSHSVDQQEDRRATGGRTNRKSAFENAPAPAAGKRRTNLAVVGGDGKNMEMPRAGTGTKLENQSLFSDSLENVMSDFEETLSRGGARTNKDYSSDYETAGVNSLGKKRGGNAAALNAFQRSPALKAGAGRADGYTSDCGYAVPSATANRPTTLRFVAKPSAYRDTSNHYYASPNAINSAAALPRTPATMEYATGDAATAHLHTSTVSGSGSSLSPASSPRHINGGTAANAPVSLDMEAANSTGGEINYGNSPRALFQHSYHQSQVAPLASDLLSPRLVASSPLPPKPTLGLSGRIGAQIEQLASHLNPSGGFTASRSRSFAHNPYDDTKSESSATRRLLELEHSLRAASGPALREDSRRLQDELNRLVNDGKRSGYRRAITPTTLDTASGDGYATALAKAMSTVAASERQRQCPEPPPRRESVSRMQTGGEISNSTPGSPAISFRPRIRTYSAAGQGSGNGWLNMDAFHSYRRTNPVSNSSSSSNATTSTIIRPLERSLSVGRRQEADYVSDSEYALGDRPVDRFASLRRSRHLLSRPQSTLPPAVAEQKVSKPSQANRLLTNPWRKEVEENAVNEQSMNDVKANGVEKQDRSAVVQGKQQPLMRTIGVLTDVVKPVVTSNASTCTPPLPQPKPCTECDGLRQRLLALSIKPLTFTRGTATGHCTCSTCERQSRQSFKSLGTGTSALDTAAYRRDAAATAAIELPCEECETRNAIEKIAFGVNTTQSCLKLIERGANTEFVEVRNRHANTERKDFQSCSTNTEAATKKDASSIVETQILLSCGAYRSITSNTTPPLMVTFGVNTDPTVGTDAHPSQEAGRQALTEEAVIDKVRNVVTREEGTMTDDRYSARPVTTRSVGIGPTRSLAEVRMIDKYVDSTVRTRDVGTRTPPPPPPPLLPLRSSGSQTVDPVRTMVSVGSGDSTVELSQCDWCSGREDTAGPSKPAEKPSSAIDVQVQTEHRGIDQLLPFARKDNIPRSVIPASPPDQTSVEYQRVASVSVVSTVGSSDQSISNSERIQQLAPVESGSTISSGESQIVVLENSSTHSSKLLEAQRISVTEGQKAETKVQRGIQRVFSPKAENCQETDAVMWTSQNSAVSDASSGRGAEPIEDSTVVCPLDDDEEKGDDGTGGHDDGEESRVKQEHARKFDFTKPRSTRAFALSRAAAAKKLLTSDSQGQSRGGGATIGASGRQQQKAATTFQRNYVQSKSVRLDTKKGDPLAYITDKKQFQHAKPPTGPTAAKLARGAGDQTAMSTGLKGKVAIKKNAPTRKVTPVPSCPRQAATSARLHPMAVAHRRASSLPGAAATSSSVSSSSSLKDDDTAAEADDVVGPLPSEMATIRGRSSAEAACYTNPAAENGDDEEDDGKVKRKRLVGDVVDQSSAMERNEDKATRRNTDSSTDDSSSSEAGDDTDESFEEGSYDTNGNISSTCDVAAASTTVSEGPKVNGESAENAAQKLEISPQLRDACRVLNDFVSAGMNAPGEQVEWAQKFVQHEWLKTSASKRANPSHVGDFLDILEEFSPQLLQHVVNYCDQNENTALHYAVSRGHFDIVSILLDTKMCNLNKPNKAGYTPVMLASLCPISSDTDSMVIQRLFQMGDVNIKASQHGQTALMLAVSHGNLETTKLLLEAGAGVNIQDEEGSTALMCAAEHGHKEIVRLLLAHPEIDASLSDNDKSTALSIAVENDHKDIGILIYAHLNYGRSPPSLQSKSAPVWC